MPHGFRIPFLALAVFAVSACSQPAGPSPGSAPPAMDTIGADPALRYPDVQTALGGENLATCGGNGFVRYVGVPLIRPGDRLPREGAYLHWEDLPGNSRVLGPGVMATMDHVPTRLTVVVDDEGRIHRLYCG